MKNLFKNTLRSLPRNKLNIISLVFLFFLCLSIFCTMSNTFSNITTQYDNIVKSGNLHDIVISELYDIGEPNYEITNPDWVVLTDIKIEDKNWFEFLGYAFWGEQTSKKNIIPTFSYKKKDEIDFPIFWESNIEIPIHLNKLNKKIEKGVSYSNEDKKRLLPFYLALLFDENYIDWDSFVEKFNDDSWKNQEKNKPIITQLAMLLSCSIDKVNQDQISNLDQQTKDHAKALLDSQKKLNDEIKENKEKLIVFYLGQLGKENYENWDSFVAKFKNENWKNEEKNMKIIGELCTILKCQLHEIYDKINDLDQQSKDQAKKLLDSQKKFFDSLKMCYCCVNKEPWFYNDNDENLQSKDAIENIKKNLKFPFFVLPKMVKENGKIVGLEYNFKLSSDSTGLIKSIIKNVSDDAARFKIFIAKNNKNKKSFNEINEFFSSFNDFKWESISSLNNKKITHLLKNIADSSNEQIVDKLKEQKKIFLDTFNPLKLKLKKYSDKLTFKDFSSFTIDSADSLVKVINSNPIDKIDKIVLFPDTNGNKGYDLFSRDDYAPNGANLTFFDSNGNKYSPNGRVGQFIVPQNINDLFKIKLVGLDDCSYSEEEKFLYAQIVQKRFKWICNGEFINPSESNDEQIKNRNEIIDCVSHLGKHAPSDYKLYYESLFQHGEQHKNQLLKQKYEYYFKNFYDKEFVNHDSVFLTIEWNFLLKEYAEGKTTILTSQIHNLFDLFTVLNPEYMRQNKKEVIATLMFTNFEPFVQWYKLMYPNKAINVDKKVIIDWINWITYEEYEYWLKGGKHEKKFKLPKGTKDNQKHEITCKNWKGIEKKYLYNCSNFDFIIIGCGITPDFIYPSISLTKLISNPKRDCLVYLNDGGFKQIQLSHVNAPVENFVVCKFNANVSLKEQEAIVNEIRDWSKKIMIFPDGVNNVFFNNDRSNQLNANTFRISYLPNIIKLFKIISYIICGFIFLLAIIICIIIIKYYVDANKVNIGILLANGIKKNKIIFSLLPFVWIPSIIGGISAYLFGLFMQVVGLKLFKNYWFLPTKLISFNYITMLLCILFPFIIFSLTSFFSTLKMLNSKLTFLLNKQSDFKGNLFSRIAKIPFAHFGIMTRFRIASAFASFWRLLILSITISIAMSGSVFAIATLGKIDASNKTNTSQFSYKHAIELITPTANGGNFNTFNFNNNEQIGFFQTNSNNYIFNTTIDQQQNDPKYYSELTKPYYSSDLNERYKNKEISGGVLNSLINEKSNNYFWSYYSTKKYYEPIADTKNNDLIGGKLIKSQDNVIGATSSIGTLPLFNEGDNSGKDNDLFYMQGKCLSKLALEHDLGIPSIQSDNPWRKAASMMPLNYQNLANKSLDNLIQKVGQKIYDPNSDSKWHRKWDGEKPADIGNDAYKYFIVKTDSGKYKLSPESGRFTITSVGFSKKSTKLAVNPYFIELLKTIYSDPELASEEFVINYGSIPLNINNKNNDDETYTYVEGIVNDNNFTDKIKILGLQRSSKHVKIIDNNNDLLAKLYDYKQKQNDIYPIVINSYVAFKNKLKVGDKFSFNPKNCVDRFLPQQKKKNDNCQFEIIGIAISTANELFFTTQYFANKILGLPDGKSWNKTHKYMLWTNENDREQWQTKSMIVDLASDKEYLDLYHFVPEEGKFKKIDDNKKEKYRNKHFGNDKHISSVPIGFNGIFTKTNIDDSYLKFISLYSLSGLYPGASTFTTENPNNNKFSEILSEKTGHNLALANFITGLNDEKIIETIKNNDIDRHHEIIDNFCHRLTSIYGKTTSLTAIKTADDLTTMRMIFDGLIYLFNLIQYIIVAVFFPIAILIVMVISSLLIKQNQKYAIMLKSLGYSDLQNTKNILSLYVPISIIGVFLSVPFTLLLATSYQMLILKSVKILIYSLPTIFHYLIGCGLIFAILTTCALHGYISLKKVKLNKEIKS